MAGSGTYSYLLGQMASVRRPTELASSVVVPQTGVASLAYSRSVALFGRLVRDWWSEPVDYAAQVQYFSKRSISTAVQVLIGLGTGFDAVISAVVLLPSASTSESRLAVAVFVALQLFWAWVWCFRPWPPRWGSVAFVVTADIAITVMVVLDTSWVMSSFGLSFFTMLSVYLIFFEGPKALVAHITWILATTAALSVRIGIDAGFDVFGFTAKTLLSVGLIVGTPLGIQAAIWALRNDANESISDPLTGLLNRRGLHRQFVDLVHNATKTDTEVTVMVIDLDRFKDVNDNFGHTVGDAVLIGTARQIKSAVRGSALVARVGGEEFVVVDLASGRPAHRDLDRVRLAIATQTDYAVTASVGVVNVAVANFAAPDGDPAALLDATIERADQAMFTAKRNGGNATEPL